MALEGKTRTSQPRWRTNQLAIVLLASILGSVAGCGGNNQSKPGNPVPVLTSMSPATAVAGDAGFTLTVTGTGFKQGAQVQWAGADRVTSFVGATQLSAAILASDLAQVGSFDVTVRNPAPTAGSSNALQFAVTSAPPPPPIRVSLSPATAEVEVGKAVQFTAVVTGTATTAVNWSVSGIAGGNSAVGTITDTGEYTAPLHEVPMLTKVHSGLDPVPGVWWKPAHNAEEVWVMIAFAWCMVLFAMMPLWHLRGGQNPSGIRHRVEARAYAERVAEFIAQYKVGEDRGFPVVEPPPGSHVYLQASMWAWTPVLRLHDGVEYTLHLSSLDVIHGFSLFPLNVNFQVVPGYDYGLRVRPNTSGEFQILCNEFCGIGHHLMTGKVIVVPKATDVAGGSR